MMSNFSFLQPNPKFATFTTPALTAEKILPIDPAVCILNCRRAMEFAVKWMYSVDKQLVKPYDNTLAALMNTEDFRDIVGPDLWRRMELIRKLGNHAAHREKKITREHATLCLENLWYFLDFVACCYGESYTQGRFDPSLPNQTEPAPAPAPSPSPM